MARGAMSNDFWRWADPTGQQRRVRLDELRAALAGGVIAPNTPVWKPGWKEWQAAHEVPELTTSALSAANGVVPNIPPPPLAVVAVQQEFETRSAESFHPPAPGRGSNEEPPPPPVYVPLPVKAASMPPPKPAAAPPPAAPAAAAGQGAQKSLPTTIGLPPPPEIAAMAAAKGAAAAARKPPPAISVSPKPPPAVAVPPKGQPPVVSGQRPPIAIGNRPPPPRGALSKPPVPPSRKPPPPKPEDSVEELDSNVLMTEAVSSSEVLEAVASAQAEQAAKKAAKGDSGKNIPPAPSSPSPSPSSASSSPSPSPVAAKISSAPPPAELPSLERRISSSPTPEPVPVETGPETASPSPAADDAFAEEPIAGLPRGGGLQAILDDVRELRAGRRPRHKQTLPVLGVAGASLLILLIAGISSAVGGGSSKERPVASSEPDAPSPGPATSPAETAAAPPPTPVAAPTGASEPLPAENVFRDCKAAGEAKALAPRAVVASGVEARSLKGSLVLGFASSPHDVVAMTLDPSTLAASATDRARVLGDARRVTPMIGQDKILPVADVDRKGDKLGSRRLVPTRPPLDVGVDGNALVWAPHGKDSSATLFTLEGDGPVEALRAVPLAAAKGIAVAFRRGGAIYVGAATGDGVLTSAGGLSRIAGLGQVGSPALAVTGDRIVVAWADRAGGDDPWQIRFANVPVGKAAEAATSFTLPPGGLGTNAMSPALTGLGGGRFLLAWTEGPVSSHQVRVAALNQDGSLGGSAFAVSTAEVNAGQPAVQVAPDGRGVVAFFAAKGKTFELQAAPIACTKP